MKIGLIGVGAIGTFLLNKINTEKVMEGYQITAIFDDRKGTGKKSYDGISIHHELESFLHAGIDIVVECANGDVVGKYGEKIISKMDFMVISVGALARKSLYESLKKAAKASGHKLYLPTGAIGGLDILRSAHILGGLETVTLETRKPSTALASDVVEETVVFQGSAKEAIERYPKNANIACLISLAGIGVDKTKVTIIADPSVTKNIHHLQASGEFGTLELNLENYPSRDNPKTSQLTALSMLASLKNKNAWCII